MDAPLPANVDLFCNSEKDSDVHREALNAVVIALHRAGLGGFEALIASHLGPYLTNEDPKLRERGTLLCAEVLTRLPELPLNTAAVDQFLAFFTAR